ncbi:outer membrane protein [Hasllibacter sp. MH4015]|uniref:outer membrane protein n=1 Tax=Hasllibacter sp. MH4015 TaxID=2854029 RepID=UPI001CD3B9A5|nr:outer membrane beta-barrel protein [Hasllibacter sp. MH4015]
MNRLIVPLIAMAFSTPVYAQSSLSGDGSPWSGSYFGFQYGIPTDSTITSDVAPASRAEMNGNLGGAQIGFRRQNGSLVYGAEIAFLVGEQVIEETGQPDVDVRVTTTRFGGQAGYAFGRVLPYGTAGIGRMTFQDTTGFGDTASFGTYAGFGLQYQLAEDTSVGLEAVRHNYSDFDRGNSVNVTQTNMSFRLNFHF